MHVPTRSQPLSVLLMVGASALVGCRDRTTGPEAEKSSQPVISNERVTQPVEPGAVDRAVVGQTIYVPVYSSIYDDNARTQLPLTATLTIRNTDATKSLIVKSVKYHDTAGKLVRSYVEAPVGIKPMATLSYIVERTDRAGTGANFVVEWVATETVTPPVAEAVMINSRSQQGISFVSQGRVIRSMSKP